jgi:hypothetical protein
MELRENLRNSHSLEIGREEDWECYNGNGVGGGDRVGARGLRGNKGIEEGNLVSLLKEA